MTGYISSAALLNEVRQIILDLRQRNPNIIYGTINCLFYATDVFYERYSVNLYIFNAYSLLWILRLLLVVTLEVIRLLK